MKIQIVKKKASSNRELGRERVEIKQAATLRELLTELTLAEMKKQEKQKGEEPLGKTQIGVQAELGRVSFGVRYNENVVDKEKAVQVMIQDFTDGLFRVYLNREECLELDAPLVVKEEDEVVLIRLVMLAGRMW